MGRKKFARKRRIRNFDNDLFVDMLAHGYTCKCDNTQQRTEILRYLDGKHFFTMNGSARLFLRGDSACEYMDHILFDDTCRFNKSTGEWQVTLENRIKVVARGCGHSDLTIGYQEFKTLTSGVRIDENFMDGLMDVVFSEVA